MATIPITKELVLATASDYSSMDHFKAAQPEMFAHASRNCYLRHCKSAIGTPVVTPSMENAEDLIALALRCPSKGYFQERYPKAFNQMYRLGLWSNQQIRSHFRR